MSIGNCYCAELFRCGLRVEDVGWKVKWNANALTRCTDKRAR